MFSLTSYLEYAKSQNRSLSQVNGIVIYTQVGYEIPSVMFFMPAQLNYNQHFDEFLENSFANLTNCVYAIYPQPIRWILPDLADIIRALKFKTLQYGILKKTLKVSYVKFTFDKTYEGDPDTLEDTSVKHVPIIYNGKNFHLNVSDLPNKVGVPKLIEKINF